MPPVAALVREVLRRAPAGAAAFLTVGLAGLALDTAVFSALHALGVPAPLARLISLAAATVLTWRLNRRWAFAATGRRSAAELTRYAAVALGAQGFSYLTFLTLLSVAPALPPAVSLWIGAVLAAGASYAGQRWFTFAPTETA